MPHKSDYKAEKAEMMMGKDESGAVDPEEIEPFTIELPHADFPELKDEEEGDSVMALVTGEVVKKTDGSCVVEFDKAAVIHGKMTPGQKKKVMRFEDALEGKAGVKNKYALARHIVLKKKKSGGY